MKISWVQGVIMLYLLILGCELMANTGGGGVYSGNVSGEFRNVVTENQSTLIEPAYSSGSSGGVISNIWTVATNIGPVLATIAGFLVLWSPTVFSGNLLWAWWFICFPTDVAMIFAILAMVRGVHSG